MAGEGPGPPTYLVKQQGKHGGTDVEYIIAIVFGLAALGAQNHELPQDFVEGALTRSEPVIEATFVGVEWPCGDETCYSGYRLRKDVWRPVTGT